MRARAKGGDSPLGACADLLTGAMGVSRRGVKAPHPQRGSFSGAERGQDDGDAFDAPAVADGGGGGEFDWGLAETQVAQIDLDPSEVPAGMQMATVLITKRVCALGCACNLCIAGYT